MTAWSFSRSPHTLDLISGLPLEGQLALFDLIGKLEDDPGPHMTAFGEDDGLTRSAVFGDQAQGIVIAFVNEHTRRITALHITWNDSA